MKLRKKWYPYTLPERAAWHSNFKTQAVESGADYGLTAAQIAQTVTDADVVEYFNEQDKHLKQEMKNWNAARDEYLDGNLGAGKPKMPTFDVPAIDADAMTAIAER